MTLAGQHAILPQPTGPFPVGAEYLVVVDTSRSEPFTQDMSDHRTMTVQVWYPAQVNETIAFSSYILSADEIVPLFDLPPCIRDLHTYAKRGLEVSDTDTCFPVIIFNHGWGEHFAHNTILMEDLASHGYIVFSIAHHYEVKFSLFPDGSYITIDETSPLFRKIMAEQRNPQAIGLFKKMFDARTRDEQQNVFIETNNLLPTLFTESAQLWVDDIISFIDHLEEINRSHSLLTGKLNHKKLGILGMSMGGIAAGLACVQDNRCRTGISLDGGLYGNLIDTIIPQPFMFINSRRYQGYDEIFLDHVETTAHVITLSDADHQNFSDLSVLDPSGPMMGTIDGLRMMNILRDYTRIFFDRHLKDTDHDFLDQLSQTYPEVLVASKSAQQEIDK